MIFHLRQMRRTASAFLLVLAAIAFCGAALPCTAAPPLPTARYTFDEGTGRTAAEAGGDAPATLRGNAMWGPGLVGEHALRLTGATDGCAEVLRPVVDTAHSYTVMAWVRVNRVGGYQTFVIKRVNPAGRTQTVHINVTGEYGAIAPTGVAITLSSPGPRDTNMIGEPNKIVPVSRPLTGLGRTFDYLLPAYSITVLDLPTLGRLP